MATPSIGSVLLSRGTPGFVHVDTTPTPPAAVPPDGVPPGPRCRELPPPPPRASNGRKPLSGG